MDPQGSSRRRSDGGLGVVHAYRDREPRRGRDAADPRGEGDQRVGLRPDPDGGAAHRGREPRDVRARGRPLLQPGPGLGASLHRPGGPRAGPGRDRRGRGVAGLGLRGRGPAVRRPVRPARGHLHRPQRRGDAQARRQDRLEADRRGGGRARGSVEPRRRRDPRGRAGGRRGDRLPADAQGDRRRRRPRDPDGGVAPPSSRTPTSAPATRRCARSATARSSSSAW